MSVRWRTHLAAWRAPCSVHQHRYERNQLLVALPAEERKRIYPHLQLAPLPLGKVMYESRDLLRYVYFPIHSIVSLLYVLADGASAEISVVRNDGLICIAFFMGGETTPSQAIVPSAGHAYRLLGDRLKDELHRNGRMQILLLRYTQALLTTQMAQTALCNPHHTVKSAAAPLADCSPRSPAVQPSPSPMWPRPSSAAAAAAILAAGKRGIDPMSETAKPGQLNELVAIAARLAREVLLPDADRIDREAVWPERGLRELAAAGLTGLQVARPLGGLGEGLLALVMIAEELGRACSSTAMCFAMHCVATRVLAAKATTDQEDRYLRPIAQGRHLTTLALSEPGTGAHFFLPRTRFRRQDDGFVVEGHKSFVTSGGNADSYVISTVPPGAELDAGTFTCVVVDADAPQMEWLAPWEGVGMRGNSSRDLKLNGTRIPERNLLGFEGDQIWYIFEVVAPYFLGAMAGVYTGIAQATLDATVAHLQGRTHQHSGEALSTIPVLTHEVAGMWTAVQRARQLSRYAARLYDAGSPEATQALFGAKIEVAEAVTAVTSSGMMLSGGRGYRQNSQISRLLRDAQAAHVMSPTTQLLHSWLGRSLLGLPLL